MSDCCSNQISYFVRFLQKIKPFNFLNFTQISHRSSWPFLMPTRPTGRLALRLQPCHHFSFLLIPSRRSGPPGQTATRAEPQCHSDF